MTRSPERRRFGRRWASGILLGLVSVVLASQASAASDIEIVAVEAEADTVLVEFEINEEFFEKIVDTLERGFSATIKYTVEIWEHRRTWFDRLSGSRVTAYKIRYDSWSEEYVALGIEGELDAQSSPRDLAICRPGRNRVRAARTQDLDPGKSYYVHLSVELQPLTVEEVRELEGWLRGTLGRDEERSRSRGISRGLFSLVKNLTGFGDEVASARSESFRLGDIE